MDLFSLVIGFIVGAFTGATGHYLGEKYTDKRRSQERMSQASQTWLDLEARFPSVLAEMKDDVSQPESKHIREFFVKESGTMVNAAGPAFEYHTDVHADMQAAIAHLEDLGYIEDITPGNCPMYRMREHFIDELRRNA